MADIYNLVQQGLARNRAGKSQFQRDDQPWADLTLDIVKTIQSQKDRKNIADRAQLSDILDLTKVASSQEGFNALDSVLNSFEPSDELIPAYTAVKTNAAQRKNDYYKGKAAFSEISGNLDVYEDYTRDEIKGWDIGKLREEIIKVAELNDNLALAAGNGFNYGEDIGLRRAARASLDYHDKLNNTLQALASEGIITDEEAEAIFLGNFQETKNNVIKSSLKQISALDNDIDSLNKLMIKAKGDGVYDTLMAAISQQTGQDVTQETLAQQYSDLIDVKTSQRNLIEKRYNSWSPSPFAPGITMEDIEKEKLERDKKLAEEFAKLNVTNQNQINEENEQDENIIDNQKVKSDKKVSTTIQKPLEPSKYISQFNILPENKFAPGSVNVNNKDFKEWKNKFMEETGLGSISANRSIGKLKNIWSLEDKKKKQPKNADKIQKQIDKKVQEFTKWMNKPGMFKKVPFSDTVKKMTIDELKNVIDKQPRGYAAQDYEENRQLAKVELEKRIKDELKKTWNNYSEKEKEKYKDFDDFYAFATSLEYGVNK